MTTLSTTIDSTVFTVTTRSVTLENDHGINWQFWEPTLKREVECGEVLALKRFVVSVESLSFDGPDSFTFAMYHVSKQGLISDLTSLIEYRKKNMKELQEKAASYYELFDYSEENNGVDEETNLAFLAVADKEQQFRTMRFEIAGKWIHMGHFDNDETFDVLTIDEWFDAH